MAAGRGDLKGALYIFLPHDFGEIGKGTVLLFWRPSDGGRHGRFPAEMGDIRIEGTGRVMEVYIGK